MLFGKILRSPYAHANVVRIDTSKAESLPGVYAILTPEDTKNVGGRDQLLNSTVHQAAYSRIREDYLSNY